MFSCSHRQHRSVFHLCSRIPYRLCGINESQDRRIKSDQTIKTMLLSLDYVLDHPHQHFFRTKQQKLEYFRDTLQQTSGSCLLRESISAMEEKLAPYGFVRIHRSVLINSAFVHEIQPWPTGEYVLRIKGPREQKEYTVTRAYKKNLKLLAKSWIGTENFGAG